MDSWCRLLKSCLKPDYPLDLSWKPLNVLFWLKLDWVGFLSLATRRVLRIAVLLDNYEKPGYSADERGTWPEGVSHPRPVCLPSNGQWFGIGKVPSSL